MKKDRKKVVNVPNLRFAGFEGEWQEMLLRDIAVKISKKNADKNIDVVFSNSATQGIVLQSEYFDKDIANKENLNGYYVVEPYDFVYNPRLSSSAEVGAMSVNHTKLTGLVSPLYTVFRLSSQDVEVSFLEYIFKSKVWHNHMRSIANYGARDDRMNIRSDDFFALPLLVPQNKEQKKIAHLMQLLDDRISTQMKIIEKLESLIKGVAHSLIKNGKANIQIKDCLNCFSSTLMESMIPENSDGKYPVYGAIGIIGYMNENTINTDAILIIKDGASVGRVQYAEGKYSVTGTLNYLTPKDKTSLKYMYYCLQLFNFDKYKVGSGIPHIYFKDYGHEYIYRPALEKQKEIANVLSTIDEKLEIERKILKKYIEQKKYLLGNLFI